MSYFRITYLYHTHVHRHHGVFGDPQFIDQHQAGILNSLQSNLDIKEMNQSLFKPRKNHSVKSYDQHHGTPVQSESQHSDLLTILSTNPNESFENEEDVINGQRNANQDDENEEDTDREDKQEKPQIVKVKTINESDLDSKSSAQKDQLLETIGEEYYLYDDH